MEAITSTSIVPDRRSGNSKSNKSFFPVHSFLLVASLHPTLAFLLYATSYNPLLFSHCESATNIIIINNIHIKENHDNRFL